MKQFHLNLLTVKKIASDEAMLARLPELTGRVMPLHKYVIQTPGCKECEWGRVMLNTLINELRNNPAFLYKFLAVQKVDQVRFMKDGRNHSLPLPSKA